MCLDFYLKFPNGYVDLLKERKRCSAGFVASYQRTLIMNPRDRVGGPADRRDGAREADVRRLHIAEALSYRRIAPVG